MRGQTVAVSPSRPVIAETIRYVRDGWPPAVRRASASAWRAVALIAESPACGAAGSCATYSLPRASRASRSSRVPERCC